MINGQVLTISGIALDGALQTKEGLRFPADFRQCCHPCVVTSHKAQGWRADHVVVAAQRLTSKGAYVACSRGRQSCAIHTPDKARLMERLPEGNRRAVLDVLSKSQSAKASRSQPHHGVETARDRQRVPGDQSAASIPSEPEADSVNLTPKPISIRIPFPEHAGRPKLCSSFSKPPPRREAFSSARVNGSPRIGKKRGLLTLLQKGPITERALPHQELWGAVFRALQPVCRRPRCDR